jgi:hypothetical protein
MHYFEGYSVANGSAIGFEMRAQYHAAPRARRNER